MNETVTATFASPEALKNAVNELLGAGIPGEQFFVDKEQNLIKVITPVQSDPEILALLNRHNPTKVAEKTGPVAKF